MTDLNVVRAATRASLVVAAAIAASRAVFAVATVLLADATARHSAVRAAWKVALAASKAAFCSGVSATFFTAGAATSAAAPEIPASAKIPAIDAAAMLRVNAFTSTPSNCHTFVWISEE